MGSIKKYLLAFGIHALFWLLLLVLPVLSMAPFMTSGFGQLTSHFYAMFAYSSVVLLIIFYSNYYIFFPKFYLENKRGLYFFLIFLLTTLIIFITRISMNGFLSTDNVFSKKQSTFIGFAVFRIIMAYFLSGALVVYKRWQISEKERLISEVNFLKAQINPHFLFNTLNGIYTLVLKKSDRAPEIVSRLSSLMQYVATEATNTKVPLAKEIEYLSNYIELQKLRLTDTTQVHYSVGGQALSLSIEPLLLITFIENAFKYGVSTEKDCVIKIAINISDTELRLLVQNSKTVNNQLHGQSSEIGLENTINRLKKNYAGRYTLAIDDSVATYTINLSLQLK